ncbi:ABC transporter substrate-binding protein [Acidiphilium sp.]|uniref:ABC transporter substrate-binding protein n=1 Tax=Acidiphilium sp. TaxID=527 RepID=UPI00230AF389|nr:ABC transporter substrate-binding protein [Acidiphilium sp.]MDA8052366.1 ABC transporter substrate-binding protein [Rhodospirillales bacterium]
MTLSAIVRRFMFGASRALAPAALAFAPHFAGAAEPAPVPVGLVAALSGQSAASGEAITRGLSVAIAEINQAGGVLGRPLMLVRRDDESNPGKGIAAARELISREHVAAFFGGIDTPVSIALVPIANKEKTPFLGVWAAGTGITHNGANPNYVFRVSAVDTLVDQRLLRYAVTIAKAQHPGLMLIDNPWGESNHAGLEAAAKSAGVSLAGAESFESGDTDMIAQLTRLKAAGADAIILVGNAAPAADVIHSLDRMGWNVPVISHWGISGGRFPELAGPSAEKVAFVQTYSFFKSSPKGEAVLAELEKTYPAIKGPQDIIAPVGTANAYDAMHLLALAIAKAGSTEGPAIQAALEALPSYDGLIKRYAPAFTAANHDALGADDYIMVHFAADKIVPVE